MLPSWMPRKNSALPWARKALPATSRSTISKMIPAGRMADPSEIAKVALFLASEQNSYLTGQNIVVDGGFVNV